MAVTARASAVPIFQLYGEMDGVHDLSTLHVEPLSTRSGLHNWEIRPHRHNGLHQILLIEHGSGEAVMDDVMWAFTGPCLIAVPPLLVHGFHFAPGSQGHVVTVSDRLIAQLAGLFDPTALAGLLDAPAIFRLGQDVSRLSAAFDALGTEFRSGDLLRGGALTARLGLVLIEIARTGAAQDEGEGDRGAPSFALVRAFRGLVDKHAVEHWSVGDYAASLFTTKARLNAACQRFTGRSPLQLANDRLVVEAKRSLIHTSMSVGEISFALGFREAAYFCRFFTHKAGCPPSIFRRRWETERR